jgi:hypothetical protein
MTPRSSHRLVSLACGALIATVLTGCGAVVDTDTDEADAPLASRTVRPTRTPAPGPSGASAATSPAADGATTQVPAEDTAAEQPSRAAGSPITLSDRLLTAEELPAVGNGVGWKAVRTNSREPRGLAGTCHRFGMLSIGAMRVAHRDFAPADGGDAGHANELVATFADAKTAWRAFEVLKSWRDDCDARLGRWTQHDVGPMRAVLTGTGEAHSYLLTYGPAEDSAGSSHFDAESLVLVGNRIAVLRIDHVGRENPDAAGKEPVAAIRAAAAKLR